ncbi:hypothetical protein X805_04980 [Sphaerotilus natans subsp. natans DSM 6575]|uniref:Uncharacterized protein n=1 Tax=Sphaerotilus natans subsp. natans DSM 6575 TaxID=1286631 RepID=A0A059KRT9_9BURK|nr:hypothetical protein [Sphaerotilus natans]KDB53944.1 hypothetical protein X805_04980 [Sphaerotilus natans subsp. natans DSM 6575]SIR67665.1 hypothetical protein SAMN05421778_11460 [Sphaerotilus natans]
MHFIMRPLPRFPFTAQLQQGDQTVEIALVGQAMTPRQYKAHIKACELAGGDFDSTRFLSVLIPEGAGIVDEAGDPVAWNEDTIDVLLWQDAQAFQVLLDAYRAGASEAARKN